MRAEDVALCLKLGAPLRKIEQLSVADNGNAASSLKIGCRPSSSPKDAQPAMGETKSRCKQETGIVGAAMNKRVSHASHEGPVGLSTAR